MALTKKQYIKLYLYQGETFDFKMKIKDKTTGLPIDTTNYVFEMFIRKSYSDANTLLKLTETNGRITHVDDANGIIQFTISATDTANLPIDTTCETTVPPSEFWVYDVEGVNNNITPNPPKIRYLQGEIQAFAEVTK